MGYEIDFLPVGNGDKSGDAIAIRYGNEGNYKIMVIDGGTKESGEELVNHIKTYYKTDYVDYVVNTHPDQDHASGLSIVLENLRIGELWLHRPWNYTQEIIEYFHDGRITVESLKNRFQTDGFRYAYALENLALKKGIIIKEPYQGAMIGAFVVMSPNRNWYLHQLIPDFNRTPEKKMATDSYFARLSESIKGVFESLDFETLKEGGVTSSDNESSVVLYAEFDGRGVLLTGDAGLEALNQAHSFSVSCGINLQQKLKFIQIPHHGSRRNIAPSVLNKILGGKGQSENKTAFISAGEESTKHPRKIVSNAFIRRGCKVIQTKGSTKRHHYGMPNRDGWTSSIPVPFYNQVENYD
jgi:beta-lactamase superfamily II metal-dependent hydrolase